MAGRVRWLGAQEVANHGFSSTLGEVPNFSMSDLDKLANAAYPRGKWPSATGLTQGIDGLNALAQQQLGEYQGYLQTGASLIQQVANGDYKGAITAGLSTAASAALAPFLGPAAALAGPAVGAIMSGIFGGSKQESAAEIQHAALAKKAAEDGAAFVVNKEKALMQLGRSEANIWNTTLYAAAANFALRKKMNLPTPIPEDDWGRNPDNPYVRLCREEAKKILAGAKISVDVAKGDDVFDQSTADAYNSTRKFEVDEQGPDAAIDGLSYFQLIKRNVDKYIYDQVIAQRKNSFQESWDDVFLDLTSQRYVYAPLSQLAAEAGWWWMNLPPAEFLGNKLSTVYDPDGGSEPCYVPNDLAIGPGYAFVGKDIAQSIIPASTLLTCVKNVASDAYFGQYFDKEIWKLTQFTWARISRNSDFCPGGTQANLGAEAQAWFEQYASTHGAKQTSIRVLNWNLVAKGTGYPDYDPWLSNFSTILGLMWKYRVKAPITAHLQAFRTKMADRLVEYGRRQLKNAILDADKEARAKEVANALGKFLGKVDYQNILALFGDLEYDEFKELASKLSAVKSESDLNAVVKTNLSPDQKWVAEKIRTFSFFRTLRNTALADFSKEFAKVVNDAAGLTDSPAAIPPDLLLIALGRGGPDGVRILDIPVMRSNFDSIKKLEDLEKVASITTGPKRLTDDSKQGFRMLQAALVGRLVFKDKYKKTSTPGTGVPESSPTGKPTVVNTDVTGGGVSDERYKGAIEKLKPEKKGTCNFDGKGLSQAESLIWKASQKPCSSAAESKKAADEWSKGYQEWKAKKQTSKTSGPAGVHGFMLGAPDLSTDAYAKDILYGNTPPPAGWVTPSKQTVVLEAQAPGADGGAPGSKSGGGGGSSSDNTPIVLLGLGAVAALGYFLMKDKKG